MFDGIWNIFWVDFNDIPALVWETLRVVWKAVERYSDRFFLKTSIKDLHILI